MTDTATLTLADFLLARIAEDEQATRRAGAGVGHTTARRSALSPNVASGMVLAHYGRVRTEGEAKRQLIVAYYDLAQTCDHGPYVTLDGCCQCGVIAHALLAFASVYADHPDYREEWKP